MARPTFRAFPWLFASCSVVAVVMAACSTDGRGLGGADAAGSGGGAGATGGRTGSGGAVAGSGGAGTGGVTATGGAATGGAATGGDGRTGGASTGGRAASGGVTATGGSASGGVAGTGGRAGTGGAATGGAATGGAATGGSASGGRAQTGGAGTGGAATGGMASGGRMATGGAGTGGAATGGAGTGGRGTGGAAAEPACTKDTDCHLINTCCTCAAYGPDDPLPPACGLLCIQSRCQADQLPAGQVACVAGRCVAGFNCDASNVTCKVATPSCPAGQVPAINREGTCYTGSCVSALQCTSVTDCDACGPGQGCVVNETRRGNETHCVSIPAACDGKATCGCLGASSCVSPYTTCSGAGAGAIACTCPTC